MLTENAPDIMKLMGRLTAAADNHTFLEGETILRESAYINKIPIVISGSIRVMRTDEDGREILLYYITSGESCIMSLLGGLHHQASKVKAVAEEKTEIRFIPVDTLTKLLHDEPQWLDYIFRLYHKRFEDLLEVVNAVAFKKVDERLLGLLRTKAELTGHNEIVVTHEQLALELGTARVVVSRLLKQLEQAGRVKLERNKISLM